jgi:Fe-S-cluster containining protein
VPSGADSRRRAEEEALASLRSLHDEIDLEAGRLATEHAERLQCQRGCSACCLDDLTVASVEAERIRRAHPELLQNDAPHPIGGCAFLDSEGACRIYSDRPSVCRSQGLPLRVFFEDEDDEICERRDICQLNLEGGPALESLPEESCWLIGPKELRLIAIDEAFAGEDAARVHLRDLFARSPDGQFDR